MSVAEASTVLNLTREQAWSRLRDLGVAHKYVPGLIGSEITTEQREGVGASRRVFRGKNKVLDETVTQWHEGRGFVIRLHVDDGPAPPPFSEATFKYWLDDDGLAQHGQSRVTITMEYQPCWGALGRLLDKLLLARGIQANQERIARRIKHYYESVQA